MNGSDTVSRRQCSPHAPREGIHHAERDGYTKWYRYPVANVGSQFDEDPKGIDYALRDIAAGEEITVDYLLVEGHRPNKT